MDPVTASVGLGILGAAGNFFTNSSNRRIAERQMEFQERMSSTSAQRAVEDYKKAGLNPGLAYDRGASSPGGASTTIGDITEKGISTALNARNAMAQLEINREQLHNLRANTEKTKKEGQKVVHEQQLLAQAERFNDINQPADTALRQANALLAKYEIPGKQNTANLETHLGTKGGFGTSTARLAMEILKAIKD